MKHTHKTIFALLFALVLLLSGCGNQPAEPSENVPEASGTEAQPTAPTQTQAALPTVREGAAQQSAVEKYLGVHKFPTYIIFDRNGQRVTTEENEPRPYDPESVRRLMMGLIDNK